MSWHYIVNPKFAAKGQACIGVRKIRFPNAIFSDFFMKAKPHRPGWARRRFKKNVRLYIPRPEKEVKVRVEKIIKKEAAWWTCCLQYNFDRWRMDCSCTGQGTEEDIKARLKKFMIGKGYQEHWWEGYCLRMETLELCIECEEAVDEIKTEECKCASGKGTTPP